MNALLEILEILLAISDGVGIMKVPILMKRREEYV
jgi:hypothetical protein